MNGTISGKEGFEAEQLFLQAMKNLGFRQVRRPGKLQPRLIWQATSQEEREKKDFFITALWQGKAVRVPLQLTLTTNGQSRVLRRKRQRAASGEVALFAAPNSFGGRNFLEFLRKAAVGDKPALKKLESWIHNISLRYLKQQA